MEFKFEIGQKVRILDGSGISNYECSWNPKMSRDVGRIVTITEQRVDRKKPAYRVKETDWSYDERGLRALSSADYIKKIILNDPATIILWEDGTKTVVKTHNEDFDAEKGIAMCFMKKACANNGSFNNVFKKWITADMQKKVLESEDVPTTSTDDDDHWNPALFENPKKSGWYIAITQSGLQTELHYSKEHDKWNVFDEQDTGFADAHAIEVAMWRHKYVRRPKGKS